MDKPKIRHIIHVVAEYYRVPVAALTGPSHAAEYVRPRQVAMYLARELTGASLPQIGRAFGARHHTTVLSSCRRVERLLRIGDPQTVSDMALLREKTAAAALAAAEQGRTTRAVKKALCRLRELAEIAEEIAAECRRLEGQVEQFMEESRVNGNDLSRQESRPAYVHSGAADGRPGRPSTRDLPGRCA